MTELLFLEALGVIFFVVWVLHAWIHMKAIVEVELPGKVKREMLNMHHNTQTEVRLWIPMQAAFANGARDRVFNETIVPYARRLWIQQGDERELRVDFDDYVIAVVAK